jgi:hypothetical protein
MGSIDYGTQQIYFKYGQALVSEELNKWFYSIIAPGIYSGGLLSIVSGDTVAITPMSVIVETSLNQSVHITTTDNVELDIAEATPYITCQMTWANSASNYMDFTAKAEVDLLSTDIIIGKGVYVANVLTSFDYNERTLGQNQTIPNEYSNLLVKRNAVTPVSKIDISFDKLWIHNRTHNMKSFTIDITASGALGLDTGVESADAWYYIWIIAKADGTVSAILSASSTAPTLPAGYIYKRLVSMVRNTSGDFVDFVQENNKHISPSTLYTYSGTLLDTGTSRDVSVFIPEKVSRIVFNIFSYVVKTGAGSSSLIELSGSIGASYKKQIELRSANNTSGGVSWISSQCEIITTDRTIYTKSDGSVASPSDFNLTLKLSYFEVPL